MVEFVEITERTIRANYKTDDGNVNGTVTYTNGKMVRATGTIRKDEQYIANFNTVGDRVNLVDCDSKMMSVAVELAEAALADLVATHPEE